MEDVLDRIDERYGSVQSYVANELEFSTADIELMRRHLHVQ